MAEFIVTQTAEKRPCVVSVVTRDKNRKIATHTRNALFHRWADKAEIVPPSVLKGGHGGGVVRGVLAIVEYEDGTIGEALPENIRFLDSKQSEKEKAEFACRVCFERAKRKNPHALGCAWRCIDNEYCDELKIIMAQEDAKQ